MAAIKFIAEDPIEPIEWVQHIDWAKVRVHRSRAKCALPTPRQKRVVGPSLVAIEQNRLRDRWLTGVGWDHRRLSYSVVEIMRSAWPGMHPRAGDPRVHAILRRACVRDPYWIWKGVWTWRFLTAGEMRRVVEQVARMRAAIALSKE